MAKSEAIVLDIGGQPVRLSSPDKLYFPEAGITKRMLVDYYVAVAEGALRGCGDRPIVLKRYLKGIHGDFFFQKRAPKKLPDYVQSVTLRFPSGRTAQEAVVHSAAGLAWMTQLGNIDINPHPVRAGDLDHPDELRVDLDPGPGVGWAQVRAVAMVVKEVLEAHGLVGWPKTSGSKGMHINVRIAPEYSFTQVRHSALAIAREVEQLAPEIATSKWWKEERHGVFIDYNQNAKDRTVCSAWSVRPVPEARVSMPLFWSEVPTCEASDWTLFTAPDRLAELGDPHEGMDQAVGRLEALLETHARHVAEGAEEDRGLRPKLPVIIVSQAARKPEALEGLERWKLRHPEAAERLKVEDVLVDSMRGRSTLWYRVRLNLRNVPEDQRPPQETPDPNYDPWAAFRDRVR